MKKVQVTVLPKCDLCGQVARYDAHLGGRWGFYCIRCAQMESGLTQSQIEQKPMGTIFTLKPPQIVDNSDKPIAVVELVSDDGDEWYATCPSCGYEHTLEPDGYGRLDCHECNQPMEVVSIWC
jgi:hypothetical protein